jgi:hypothetical protein
LRPPSVTGPLKPLDDAHARFCNGAEFESGHWACLLGGPTDDGNPRCTGKGRRTGQSSIRSQGTCARALSSISGFRCPTWWRYRPASRTSGHRRDPAAPVGGGGAAHAALPHRGIEDRRARNAPPSVGLVPCLGRAQPRASRR